MTSMPAPAAVPGSRSKVVTVIAWFSAIGSGLAFLLEAINLMPNPALDQQVTTVLRDRDATRVLPPLYLFLLRHMHLFAVVRVIWWALLLTVSIGLLRRRDWARRGFIGLVIVAAAALLAVALTGESRLFSVGTAIAAKTGQVPASMGSGLALATLLTLAAVGAVIWLIVFLRSSRVREEFLGKQHAA